MRLWGNHSVLHWSLCVCELFWRHIDLVDTEHRRRCRRSPQNLPCNWHDYGEIIICRLLTLTVVACQHPEPWPNVHEGNLFSTKNQNKLRMNINFDCKPNHPVPVIRCIVFLFMKRTAFVQTNTHTHTHRRSPFGSIRTRISI